MTCTSIVIFRLRDLNKLYTSCLVFVLTASKALDHGRCKTDRERKKDHVT